MFSSQLNITIKSVKEVEKNRFVKEFEKQGIVKKKIHNNSYKYEEKATACVYIGNKTYNKQDYSNAESWYKEAIKHNSE